MKVTMENRAHATHRASIAIAMIACAAPNALAQTRFVDFSRYPNGQVIPNATVLTTQLSGYGVVVGARRSNEPVGLQGSVNFVSYGSGSTQCAKYWFFSPDVFGATAIFSFVDPATGESVDATSFEFGPDFDSSSESLDVVGLDSLNQVVASKTVSSCGRCAPQVVLSGVFRRVEIRTRGNPGIGFGNCFSNGALRLGYTPCLSISTGPESTAACPGGTVQLSVQAQSTLPTAFEWQVLESNSWRGLVNGPLVIAGDVVGNVANAEKANMSLTWVTSFSKIDSVSLRCLVSSTCGSRTSSVAVARLCRSDLNCDGNVDDSDFETFVFGYNLVVCDDPLMPSNCPSDLDGDGLVIDEDFEIFVQAYNRLICD